MDPVVPQLEQETLRRRRRRLFSHSRVPVRMLVPNFFTLLGLCAGLTAIRMAIEQRWELALGLVVFAAMLDGIDGRVARLLKASSRFGAELDSLADFVNFGVAPAFIIFTWGVGDFRSFGWICCLIFALTSALRLARFNVAVDEEKPYWQKNYFTGMPTPAAAIVVLLPVYLAHIGFDVREAGWMMVGVLLYTLAIAFMMVSTIPTYSGKLLGERIGREWVLPIFALAAGLVALLATYPYATLAAGSLLYLAMIPVGWQRYRQRERLGEGGPAAQSGAETAQSSAASAASPTPVQAQDAASQTALSGAAPRPAASESGRVVEIRPGEPKR